jgi:hypothetical protein
VWPITAMFLCHIAVRLPPRSSRKVRPIQFDLPSLRTTLTRIGNIASHQQSARHPLLFGCDQYLTITVDDLTL